MRKKGLFELMGALLVRYNKISLLFIVLAGLYLCLSVFTKPDAATIAKYHITQGQFLEISLAVAIPYILIWAVALRGYLGLRAYVDNIRGTKDGVALTGISRGVFLLALWLPLSTLLSSLLKLYYDRHPAATASAVRISNYVNAALLLLAFVLIYQGARKLLPLVRAKTYELSQKFTLSFIAFSALYVMISLADPTRHAATATVKVGSYYLADWLIVATLLIPRLIAWYLGLQAVHLMYFYKQHVKGSIYKVAFDDLAKGIAAVILAIITLRCLESLSIQLNDLALAPLIILVYLLLILIAVGYAYIMRGAKRLQQFEK